VLSGRQKRFLRSLGMTMEPLLHIGKDGVTPPVVRQAVDALRARELIKGRALPTTPDSVADVAASLAEATESVVVQVIGRNFLLFKPNDDDPKLQLPV